VRLGRERSEIGVMIFMFKSKNVNGKKDREYRLIFLFEIIVLKIRTGELTEKKNRKETETRHGN
jgi:hypothetical protein